MSDTIIIGSLNDEELKKTIDLLVKHVDQGVESMKNSFDGAIKHMKDSLKSLGDVKVDMGNSSDGGASRRTKINADEAKSVKDTALAYDNLATSIQKATQPKSAEQSFYTFIQNYREQAAKLAREIKEMPSLTTDRQLAEHNRYANELKEMNALLADYKRKLDEIQKNPNATRVEKKAALEDVEAAKQLIKQMEEEQIRSVQRISNQDREALEQKKKKLEEIKKIIHDLTVEEKGGGSSATTSSLGNEATKNIATRTEELRKQNDEKVKTIAYLREEIAMLKSQREAMGEGSTKLKEQNDIIAQKEEHLKKELMSQEQLSRELKKQEEALERQRAKDLKKAKSGYIYEFNKANTESSKDLDAAEQKLRNLRSAVDAMKNSKLFNDVELNKAQRTIETLEQKIERLRSKRPMTLKDVLGMDESSVDAISKKMSALKSVSIDPKNASQVRTLGNEYQRLSRLQAELLGKNIQLTHSNNYLAQSFGYIRNRIVYALTLGAITSFVKQIYEVRGQYELLERSLGILIDNMRRGSEIFNELNTMALKSPFTLMELATGAKQLLAYNFAEDEVVDTTRRLADISSALGVSMERLVYNLGQIKAQTVLTARDARDFANAGLAIVPMLAEMYTKQKKFGDEIVTTSQVYDMMSKKMVSYADVMKVINNVTDEGGKFFDFQAKQAGTMKVQMANLTLSWNNMLNEIGKEHQDLLSLPLRGLKTLFENWRQVAEALKVVIGLYGLYIARARIVALVNATITAQSVARTFLSIRNAIGAVVQAFGALRIAIASNPLGLIASALASVLIGFELFGKRTNEITQYTERFGESGGKVVRDVEALYTSLESLDKESSSYKKVVGELNRILDDFNLKQIQETDNINEVLKSREKNIQLIKEEIIERKHLNDIQQGRDTYEEAVKNAREYLRSSLQETFTTSGLGFINEEIAKNAPALTNIISDIIESNIDLVANKTGDEYEKGVEKIFAKIREKLKNNKALGLSEETLNSPWLENSLLRIKIPFINNPNIIENFINNLKDAKEEQDRYNNSVNENYEAVKKAADQGVTFNDRLEQTTNSLMAAANDTDKFYGKLNQLVKDYSGENIVDFLVRVKSEVPSWMAKMSATELAQLSARFAALASQASKSGKKEIPFKGGTKYTTEQLYERAAQYAEAYRQKQADEESKKSTTLTKEASQALKDYKESLEAVHVAENKVKQGTADKSLVTEKKAEAQKKYNAALEKGVSLEDLRSAKSGKSSKKDPLGDALQKEVEIITNIQKLYKEYQKMGVDAQTSITKATDEYARTLASTNATLNQFGIKTTKSGKELANMDLRDLRSYYTTLLDMAVKMNNAKGIEVLEKAIKGLNMEITKIDYKKLTDGLNNELGKLKDEYELGIELDASPELGGIFADMMGISQDELQDLPRNFEQFVSKAQDRINRLFKENGVESNFNLVDNLNLSKFDEWVKKSGQDIDSNLVNELKKYVTESNKIRLDESKKQIEEWNNLLEKYSEYEYKVTQIQKEAEKQRETARKAGATKEVFDAINRWEKQELANLSFEEFQKSPEWIVATGDLANLSKAAIGMLIAELEKYKKSAKNLSPKQIKEMNRALSKLYKEQRKGNPFAAIANVIDEAKNNMSAFDEEIEKVNEDIAKTEVAIAQATLRGEDTSKLQSKLKNLRETWKKLREEQEAAGKIDATTMVGAINETISAVSAAVGVFNDLAKAIGGVNENDIDKTFAILDKAGQGALIGAQIGQGYGAIIGAAAGLATGLIQTFANAGNEKITRNIEKSEAAVKRLENAYKDLEYAVNEAYGTMQIGARKAAVANRELQLEELQRQLELEKSRKSKNRDENRMADLEGQIIDLKNELKDMRNEITNSFLGISSVSDAVTSMMDAIVDSLRNGEDAMQHVNDSVDDMIANMIKQVFGAKVVAPMIEDIWNKIDDDIQSRGKKWADDFASWQSMYEHILTNTNDTGQGFYFLKKGNEYQATDKWIESYILQKFENWEEISYEQWKKVMEDNMKNAENELKKATSPTMDDVRNYAGNLRELSPELQSWMDVLGDILREMGLIKDTTSEKALSGLQQGIQGVTEDTAGAIEAYMNGVSQQVYLHSTILTQIRDAVLGFELDVQVATISQMLLQLQQSYQVQQSIEQMLQNVLNPSGRAFVVELAN